MGMSDLYGATDEKEALQTIRSALDVGINLLDTGDFYGMGVNEHLIARALKEFPRDKVLLSVKFGALRDLAGNWIGFDGRPEAVRNFIAYSLRHLKPIISIFIARRVLIRVCQLKRRLEQFLTWLKLAMFARLAFQKWGQKPFGVQQKFI